MENPQEPTARAGRAEPAERRALLVLGMHRSGTSAISGVLGLAGADLPRTMMPAAAGNPLGYFESQAIQEAHEALFRETGTAWDDLSPFPPERWQEEPWAEEWIERLAGLAASEFGDSRLFVLKDPRICRLLPLWKAALARKGIDPAYVLTVRSPLEVASSLQREHGTRLHRALLLWLDHLITAESLTRGEPRIFLAYDALLGDWRGTLARVQAALGLSLPPLSSGAEDEIEAFLDRDLRHHDRTLEELRERSPIAEWVREADAWAREASAGRRPSPEPLDRIAGRLRDAERAFGPLLAAERADYLRWNEEAREMLEHRERASADLRRELESVQRVREDLSERLQERDRELSRSVAWIQYLFGFASKTRWGESPPGEMMQKLFKVLNGADPGDVPELASAGLRWLDGAREIATRDAALAEKRELCDRLRDQVVETEASLKDLEATHAAEREGLAAQLEHAIRDGKAYAARVTELGTELALAESELAGRASRIADLEAAAAVHRYALEELRRRIEMLESSRSWRFTRPLRAVGRGLRAILAP